MVSQNDFFSMVERFQSFFGSSYKEDHKSEIFRIIENWEGRVFRKCLENFENNFLPKPNSSLPRPYEFKRWAKSENARKFQEPEDEGEPNPFQNRYIEITERATKEIKTEVYQRIFGNVFENKRLNKKDYGSFGNAWLKNCDKDDQQEFHNLLDRLEAFLNGEIKEESLVEALPF